VPARAGVVPLENLVRLDFLSLRMFWLYEGAGNQPRVPAE